MEPNSNFDSTARTGQYSRDTRTNPVIYLIITLTAVSAVAAVALLTVMVHEMWMVSHAATAYIALALPAAAAIIYLDIRSQVKRQMRRRNIIRTMEEK